MKRYNNLFDKICSLDNLRLAEKKARKGKTNTYGVKLFNRDPEGNLQRLHDDLQSGNFKTSEYKIGIIHEPKERLIYKLPYYPDRIVHHAIMNILEPIWVGSMTADTYANIKGRGIHKCFSNLLKVLRNDPEGTRYCLKLDIRKYFPSIDHELLKKEIRRKIKDLRLLELLDEIIDSSDGLPIGNYLSQFLSNLFLTPLDHKLKEVYKVKYYFRYVDDMVFLSDSKEELHKILGILISELGNIKLEVKDNWQIFPVCSRGIDFLGYRFFHSHILLRKRIKAKIFKRLGQYRRGEIQESTYLRSISSWNGWLQWCDSWRLQNKIKTIYTNENTKR